ncbi:MAG TPA: histidine kinase dimerization/phospho-acceptor domain-containing protein [Gemmata sp.]
MPRSPRANVTWDGDHWRVVRRTLRHPEPEAVKTTPARPRYRTLVFVSAWPVAPAHELMRTLAWSLGGVSVALWVVAGLGSRWALVPVAHMTDSAKRIAAADLGVRLPVPAARDELHDLAGSFNDLRARLQDSFERQRRFTGETSHQLRTPLTAMLGQMEMALRRDRDRDEYRRALTAAVAQAGRLVQIVESLLFLARA